MSADRRAADASARGRLAVPRLVGRDRDLSLLGHALDERPGPVVIAREAGIGKTRLLPELLWLRRETALVAVCPPFREPYTLGPVVDAVRRLAGQVTGLPLTGLVGALRPLFPEWAGQLPPAPEPLPDASASRHRLLRALVELVDVLGVGLFVVEDAHWADETTLELLLLLQARRERGPRLVLTYRSEDVPPDSSLRRLVARAGVVRLEPGPLDTAGTAPGVLDARRAARLHGVRGIPARPHRRTAARDRGVRTAAPRPRRPGLFAPASAADRSGRTTLGVTDGAYTASTAKATVARDQVTRKNWSLGAGRISVSGDPLRVTRPLGRSTERTVTLHNTGTAPVHVVLNPQDGSYTPDSHAGKTVNPGTRTPVRHAGGDFSRKSLLGAKPDGPATPKAAAPTAAGATAAGGA
ncbi:AAA family ATPase, partial [Streptomyces sp. 150FB]|uniref:AAA family ATPase n=1 Tax=Streptomyces sp. 150FB TaxID=1576605 RepID=UPI001364A646